MNNYIKRRKPINNAPETLSPEKRKLLHEAKLEELMKLYEKCYAEGIPRCTLIDVIEKEIYEKTIEKKQWRIDRGYKLEKFVTKKK
ncbi:MAG TPA: hypothetical protein PKY32_09460 [Smithellaceae bacterium]|jgi:hypothetical protein|nr:hypothetical protein [Spirochaetota bacterium]HNZ88912.1 hypothetical protein [Candidatus Cloacimonas acidaminovorans]HPC08978.1 hypothetical protein [Smithella sp.]HPY36010.1 hypothetical protein [Smithellaceae bacterium]